MPLGISDAIRRIDPRHFEIDRSALALIAKPISESRREYMNGQVVFMFYGRKLKLSPERVGDHWEGVRAYLDLDARIASKQLAAHDILNALGATPEDDPEATPLDEAVQRNR